MADQIEFLGQQPASMRERFPIAPAASLVAERKQMLVLAKQFEEEAASQEELGCSRRQTLGTAANPT